MCNQGYQLRMWFPLHSGETEDPRVEEIYPQVIGPVSPSGPGSSVGVAAPGFSWECISVPGCKGILSGPGAGLRSRSQWREGAASRAKLCPTVSSSSASPRSSPGTHTRQSSRRHSLVRCQVGNQSCPERGMDRQLVGRRQGLSCRARWPGVGSIGGDERGKESGLSQPMLGPG